MPGKEQTWGGTVPFSSRQFPEGEGLSWGLSAAGTPSAGGEGHHILPLGMDVLGCARRGFTVSSWWGRGSSDLQPLPTFLVYILLSWLQSTYQCDMTACGAGRRCRQLPPRSQCQLAPPTPAALGAPRTLGERMGQGQPQEGQLQLRGVLFSASAQTLAVFPPLDSFSPFGVTFLTLFPTVPPPVPLFTPVHWYSLQAVFQKESQTLILSEIHVTIKQETASL